MSGIEGRVASDPPARGRGRPRGSVSLTPEKANEVVMLLRGGASLRSAAQISGIPVRTLHEWLARGEGRSPASATPKLRSFAQNVRRAQAEARASAEVRVHERQPATWLRTDAATSGEPEDTSGTESPNPERIHDLARRLREVLLYLEASEVVPPCPNPRCRCIFHRQRTPEELAVTRAMASERGGS